MRRLDFLHHGKKVRTIKAGAGCAVIRKLDGGRQSMMAGIAL